MRPVNVLYGVLLAVCGICAGQSHFTEVNDIIYYEGDGFDDQKHRLNLVLAKESNSPLLLWVHGGAWAGGDRGNEMALARKLAREGISVAVISYRLSPAEYRDPPKMDGVQHPAHVIDVANAFKWINEHAAEYGYSKNKLFVSGFSAGAHLSALLAMDTRYLTSVGLRQEDIKGCIPVSGAYDIPKYFQAIEGAYDRTFAIQHVNGVFGSDDQFVQASPVSYIDNLNVPMLVQTDGALSLYADTFKEALADKGREDIPFSYYPSFSHSALHEDLSFSENSKARAEIVAFIKQHAN